MRQIVGIALLVLGVGMLMCRWEGLSARPVAAAEDGRWVRTVDGWERSGSWHLEGVVPPPNLHPLVVAAGQGLVSVFALVAFSTGVSARRKVPGRRGDVA